MMPFHKFICKSEDNTNLSKKILDSHQPCYFKHVLLCTKCGKILHQISAIILQDVTVLCLSKQIQPIHLK